jgi:outer membrane protein assembly factor BamB
MMSHARIHFASNVPCASGLLLVACGWALSQLNAQVVAPGQPDNARRAEVQEPARVAPADNAQLQARANGPLQPVGALRAYPDEAVNARDAMERAAELLEAGNAGESARVLQALLESEGDRVISERTSADADLYLPVRRVVERMIASSPVLLERYRTDMEAGAKALLDAGRAYEAERTRFLTPSGLESALRVAEAEFEAGRLHSARLTLARLAEHPGLGEAERERAQRLSALVCDALAGVCEPLPGLARSWNKGVAPPPTGQPVLRERSGRTPLQPAPGPAWSAVSREPLQSVQLRDVQAVSTIAVPAWRTRNSSNQRVAAMPWVMPGVEGSRLYINDGERIRCLDADTLAQLWSTRPAVESEQLPQAMRDDGNFMTNVSRSVEDLAGVAVSRGVVVAPLGAPLSLRRVGDTRVHALDARDGSVLWSSNIAWLDQRLADAWIRGLPVVEADTVVLSLRRPGLIRRMTSLLLVGLDLHTGAPLWIRTVGSVGSQPWGRTTTRVDMTTLHEGVVYRADDMGVLGAFEAATGNPLWVRLSPPTRVLDPTLSIGMGGEVLRPFEAMAPVVLDGRVFAVDAVDGAVVACDADTGGLIARRHFPEIETLYLVGVGERLALVSSSRVAFIDAKTFEHAPLALGPVVDGEGISGRAFAAGDKLLVPITIGVCEYDPAAPQSPATHGFETTGNFVIVEGDEPGSPGHLVCSSVGTVSTMLTWERAESRLKRRLAAETASPAPALTYLELSLRKGKPEHTPDLARRVQKLVEADPTNPELAAARKRMLALLLESLRTTRLAEADVEGPMIVRDRATLEELESRASLAAEDPGERARVLLERSFLREQSGKAAGAVDALQEILATPTLAGVVLDPEQDPGLGIEEDAPAWSVATERLSRVLLRSGIGAYAGYDEEAAARAAALAAMGDRAGSELWERAARMYPVSAVSTDLWLGAAAAHEREGATQHARRCEARALKALGESATLGRGLDADRLTRIANPAVDAALARGGAEPLLRMLAGIAQTKPEAAEALNAGIDRLRAGLAKGPGLASVSLADCAVSQVIAGWEPLASLSELRTGNATSGAVLVTRNGERVGFFAQDPGEGALVKVWEREGKQTPTVLRVLPERTLLFWADAGASHVECVSNVTGKSLWKTAPLSALVTTRPDEPSQRIQTPLDGVVRGDDHLFQIDETTVTLVQRRGTIAVFDLRDGGPIWSNALPLDRVFDLDQTPAGVTIVGAFTPAGDASAPNTPNANAGVVQPIVLTLDKQSGRELWRMSGTKELGDHARWSRGLPDGGAIVSCSRGLLRVAPSSGQVVWSREAQELRAAVGAWAVGAGLFVLDAEFDLRRLQLDDGTGGDNTLDSEDRVTLPFEVHATKAGLVICSNMGMVCYDEKGELIGADAMNAQGKIEPPVRAADSFVTIETGSASAAGVATRLVRMSHPDGRIAEEQRLTLHETPTSLAVLDGKVLVGQGPYLLVIDARASK